MEFLYSSERRIVVTDTNFLVSSITGLSFRVFTAVTNDLHAAKMLEAMRDPMAYFEQCSVPRAPGNGRCFRVNPEFRP